MSATTATDLRRTAAALGVLIAGLIATLAAFLAPPAEAAKPQARTSIVNGYQPHPSQWPWMVAVLDKTRAGSDWDKHFCGGTLIAPRVVLTAAHCLYDRSDRLISAATLQAGLGKRRLTAAGGEHIDVVGVLPHPSYRPDRHPYDVALLYLARPSAMTPATLLPSNVGIPRGTPATVMGWGALYNDGPSPDDLQAVDLVVWSDQDCRNAGQTAEQRQRHAALYDPQTMLCAGDYRSSKISCYGDSGGGLMVLDNTNSWRLIGVVSFDVGGCAGYANPDIYAWAHGSLLQSWIVANAARASQYGQRQATTTTTTTTSTVAASCTRATRAWQRAAKRYRRALAARKRARRPAAKRRAKRLVAKRRGAYHRAARRLSRAC